MIINHVIDYDWRWLIIIDGAFDSGITTIIANTPFSTCVLLVSLLIPYTLGSKVLLTNITSNVTSKNIYSTNEPSPKTSKISEKIMALKLHPLSLKVVGRTFNAFLFATYKALSRAVSSSYQSRSNNRFQKFKIKKIT